VGPVEKEIGFAKPIIEHHIKTAAQSDDHLVEFSVGMSAAGGTAWYIVEIIDASDLEGDLFVFLDKGEVAAVVIDFGEIYDATVV